MEMELELELRVSSLKLDEDGGEEEEEASIYLRAFRPPYGRVWYIITPDTPSGSYLNPMFLKNKHHHDRTACTVVGSRLYVLGGEEDPYLRDDARKRGYNSVTRLDKVYHADVNRRKEGWSEGEPLKLARSDPYAVTIGGQIFLFRGRPEAEVYDTLDSSNSKLLNKIPYHQMDNLLSHALLDGKHVLLLDQYGRMHTYNVAKDSYQVYKNGVFEKYHLQAFAVLDGTLYAAGFNLPGLIMSLDLTKPDATPKQVNGLRDIPKLPGPDTTHLRRLFLVPLGRRNKMALVWSHRKRPVMTVYCVRMDMHKGEDEAGGGSIVVAKSAKRSKYRVDCAFMLLNVHPIFVAPNEGQNKIGSKDRMIKSKKEDETGQEEEEMNKGIDDENNVFGDSAAAQEENMGTTNKND